MATCTSLAAEAPLVSYDVWPPTTETSGKPGQAPTGILVVFCQWPFKLPAVFERWSYTACHNADPPDNVTWEGQGS